MNKYDLSGLCMTYSMRFNLSTSKKQTKEILKNLKDEIKKIKLTDIEDNGSDK